MSKPRGRQDNRVARFRRVMDTGPIPTVTAVDAVPLPKVHGPESTVWTESGAGERRAWHVAGDGSLHETSESAAATAVRIAERIMGGAGS